MSQFIHNITNILNHATTKTARFVKPRRVHQIQISHPRRLNAYKVADFSSLNNFKLHLIILFIIVSLSITIIFMIYVKDSSSVNHSLVPIISNLSIVNASINMNKTISLSIMPNTLKCKYLITFYIRMYWGTFKWLGDWLFPSMELFFPIKLWNNILLNQKFELLIIMDAETFNERLLENKIFRLFPHKLWQIFDIRIEFETKFYSTQTGHDRQQWSMFYSDKYINCSKYIAFLDTDISFKTIILPSTLFNNYKQFINPFVFGQPQSELNIFWNNVSSNTKQWFHKKEPFNCMNYFPVILYTKHLAQLRYIILNIHKNENNFINILYRFGINRNNNSFSQFNVFCAFIWYYKRYKYKFIIQKNTLHKNKNKTICKYNYSIKYQYKSPKNALTYEYFVSKYSNKSFISFQPGIQLTTHIKYISNNDKYNQTINAMKFGYCFAINFKNNKYCLWNSKQMNKIKINIGRDNNDHVETTKTYDSQRI